MLTLELYEMRDLLLKYHVQEVGIESTSVYWIPVWCVLESHFRLKLTNPYFIKQLPRHKSDVKDVQWLLLRIFISGFIEVTYKYSLIIQTFPKGNNHAKVDFIDVTIQQYCS